MNLFNCHMTACFGAYSRIFDFILASCLILTDRQLRDVHEILALYRAGWWSWVAGRSGYLFMDRAEEVRGVMQS